MRDSLRLLSAIVLGLCFFVANVLSQQQIQAPAYKEGDRWEFRATRKAGITSTTDILHGNYEVVFIQGRLEFSKIADGQKVKATAGDAEDLNRLMAVAQDDR